MIRSSLESKNCLFEGVDIHVIECYQQINSDICGFHCLFNVFQFTKLFIDKDVQSQQSIKNGAW